MCERECVAVNEVTADVVVMVRAELDLLFEVLVVSSWQPNQPGVLHDEVVVLLELDVELVLVFP